MGKTRLVYELIRQLPPETMVFAPSHNLRNLSDADFKRATRYLGRRACVLVFDDLNFYVGQTDVAELSHVVAEQASICSIAVTCTTSTLPQVRSEAEPALSRFFSRLDQYEILRMTDEQMDVLAADPAGLTAERAPHDCGGNPGLFLLDFRRLHGEFRELSNQERAVAEAIHALFVAGISPIRVEQVRALASSGFGANLDIPAVNGALERLRSMLFIRESNPVLPEEAFLNEVVREDAARARMDQVEGVLRELGDAQGLFQLGDTHYYDEDFERASRVMRLVADMYRSADTPKSLVSAARALFNLGIALADWGRPQPEVEAAYREAVVAGREAATPEGLVETTNALFNLGNALARWGRPQQEVEAAYRDAVAAGREAATPLGLVETAKALLNLGNSLLGWERTSQEVEAAYRDAAAAGRETATPEGLEVTANALGNLARVLAGWGRAPQEVEAVYRDAVAAGREAATPEGLAATAKALFNLGIALSRWGRPQQEVEAAYRDAAAAGREAATSEGAEVIEMVSRILRGSSSAHTM